MKRRAFLHVAALAPWAALAALGVLLQACGGDDTTQSGTACDGEAPTSIDLHFHATCVSQALLDSPQPTNTVTMEASGTGHTHTLTLTDAQIADIRAGTMVALVSGSGGGHTHNVVFN